MTKTNRLFSALIAGVGLTLSLVWVLSRHALPVAHAGSIGVDIFDDIVALDGDCSLREAIKAAELDINIDGCNGVGPDVIHLNTGTYVLTRTGTGEDAGLTGDLDITNTLVIAGNGPEQTTIDATGLISDRVFHIHSTTATVVISGVRIIGGNIQGNYGGGIRVDDANLILINTIIEDNVVVGIYNYGGGLYVQDGSAWVNESQIINNEAGFGGGLSVVSGQATLNGSQIVSNTASYGGGIDITNSTFTQTGNSLIAYNASFGYGGGIAVWTSNVTLDGIQILDNESLMFGGGISLYDSDIILDNAQIAGNATDRGGGLYVELGSTVLNDAYIFDNTVTQNGGGMYVKSGNVTLNDGEIVSNTADAQGGGVYLVESGAVFTQTGVSTITHNTAGNGGGVFIEFGHMTLNAGQIVSNTATSGGGVYLWESEATFIQTGDSMILQNVAKGNGGGVYVHDGSIVMDGGQILSNTANGSGGGVRTSFGTFTQTGNSIIAYNVAGYLGGGIAASGRAMLSGARLIGNEATNGGGMSVSTYAVLSGTETLSNTASSGGGGFHNLGTLSLVNSTVSGNETAGNGGGLRNDAGTITLTFTTVASNTADSKGGGIYIQTGMVEAENTLIAHNGPENCDGFASLTSHGHNLESGATCGLTATTDLTDTNPLIDLLTEDGDAIVLPLLHGSPAIDTGLCIDGITTDQRGMARPQGPASRCDIGAYELYVPIPPTSVNIGGPVGGSIDVNYTFTATVNPITSTLPITYVWQASGGPTISHTLGLSDTASFIWSEPGPQTITVTATNPGGTTVSTHTITIETFVYLPLVVRDYQ